MSGIVYDVIETAIGALSSLDTLNLPSKIDTARLNGFRVLKSEIWVMWDVMDVSDGPLMFGQQIGLSGLEVSAVFAADPQDSTDALVNAQTKEPVWPLAMLDSDHPTAIKVKPIHVVSKIGWSVIEGKGMNFFVFVMGGNIASGSTIRIFAKHYGVWLRD